MTKHAPDLIIHNHGSIFLLDPVSMTGQAWIADHIAPDAQLWGNAIVVEHRFIDTIIEGALHDGLEVQ